MDETADLERKAAAFPSMGGVQIGHHLRAAARAARPGSAVVEVGCWLGAGTAQLALGLREGGRLGDVQVHCFDRFTVSGSEAEKAAAFGLTLQPRQDSRPVVAASLEPFGADVRLHRGSILGARWSGPAISVYVDDASKSPRLWSHAVATFAPHWIVGETRLLLMDFFYYQKTGRADHRCQQDFLDQHRDCFEEIGREPGTSLMALRYVRALPPQRMPWRSRLRQVIGV